jgi:hypothetical protein
MSGIIYILSNIYDFLYAFWSRSIEVEVLIES